MLKAWWKESVVYQIYPRSFKDSNGDGIGDLAGILEKLDYLSYLGIDVIWLCPIYESPNDDNGYDISNYNAIMKDFGTMEDFDNLLSAAHKKGMKVILDLVVNHTSDEHPWFIESRSSKENKFRDYYIWREARDGKEPNNWGSIFGGSAWQFDEKTGMYYLHCFTKKQPDLNWENPRVRSEVHELVTWWLDKGVDGFRMDVINMISKNPGYEDGEIVGDSRFGDLGPHVNNGYRVHEYLKELNDKVLSRYNVMTVGETPLVTPEIAMEYVGHDRHELNMVFHFEHMEIDRVPGKAVRKQYELKELKRILSKWQKSMEKGGWNSLFWNNHDQPRVVSRFGNDKKYWKESAKMLATCLYMQCGTPYIYQGEELGMTNVDFPDISYYRDVAILNQYREDVLERGRDLEDFMRYAHEMSRDNARTPVQWDDGAYGGFSACRPWIDVNPNYKSINAMQQLGDSDSIFNFYRELISVRKQNQAAIYGTYELLLPDHSCVYAYKRELQDKWLLILCNFSDSRQIVDLPSNYDIESMELLLDNYKNADKKTNILELMPYECRVYKK